MTSLPEPRPGGKKLGLVIDLDICVGCHACATACKEWNTSGHMGPLPDFNPYGAGAWGVWFNRVHSFEEGDGEGARTVYFPKSCLHCEEPACVTVCPTGASYKRAEDGIVLVNEAICIGCKLCSWACPYGAREFDPDAGVMKKCTLCIDRIYNENLAEEDLLPELGYRPVNKYLPPRAGRMMPRVPVEERAEPADDVPPGERLLRWVDRLLSR